MAEHALIDAYLDALGRTLHRHRDVDDLLDEVADHLLSAADRWQREGADVGEADRRALAAFGDPELVGRILASERLGGLAMPTRTTRTAGTLLIAAATAWTISFTLHLLATVAERTRPWEGLPMVLYMLGAYALLAGGIVMALGLVGLYRRHDRTGRQAVAALVVLALGALATFASWAVGVWVPLLALGGTLFAVWLRREDVAPRSASLLLGVGSVAAAIVLVAVELTIGFDGTANQQIAAQGLLFGALMAFVAGLLGLGRWLRSEEPADDPDRLLAA